MKKLYPACLPLLIGEIFLICFAVSCKKDRSTPAPAPANFAKLGLYEVIGATNRRIYIAISQVGNQKVNYPSVFDTGSTGMTLDANGVLPASMITSSGIQVAGDSVNVNGITVTTQQAIISYGTVGSEIQEYGNLAYANVTIGDANGNVTTPRIPIFLYYKIINQNTRQQLPAHSNDVFGVGPGVSFASRAIASPLSYFKLGSGITNGFKLATLNNASFTTSGTYVSSLLYIGLTPDDINSSGFIMHPLTYSTLFGYSPNIASTVTYNSKSYAATVLFDTGTPSISLLADPSNTGNTSTIPANTVVSLTTSQGFSYSYTTTASYNLTEVESPANTENRTIFSIDFFLSNEYLLDYTNHQLGLKNN